MKITLSRRMKRLARLYNARARHERLKDDNGLNPIWRLDDIIDRTKLANDFSDAKLALYMLETYRTEDAGV